MKSKIPFEGTSKQKRARKKKAFQTPRNPTQVHTGLIWKGHLRKGQTNTESAFGNPLSVASYFKRKSLT